MTETNREMKAADNILCDATGVGTVNHGGTKNLSDVLLVDQYPTGHGIEIPRTLSRPHRQILPRVRSLRKKISTWPRLPSTTSDAAVDVRRGCSGSPVPASPASNGPVAAKKGHFDIAEWLCDDPRTAPLVKIGAPHWVLGL